MKTETREIYGWKLKGTPLQLNEMHELLNFEAYYTKPFSKYFHVWVSTDNTGVHWFPKEKYYAGEEEYIHALAHELRVDIDYSRIRESWY